MSDDFTPARRLFMRAEYDEREGGVDADAIAQRCRDLAPIMGGVHALLRLQSLRDGDRVLDVGTGAGTFAIAAARANPLVDVVGVDISPGAVAAASRAAEALDLADRVTFQVADFEADPLPRADAAIIAYALSLAEDPAHVLSRVRRALPDEGRLAVLDGILPRSMEPDALDEPRLDALAADAGFARVGRLVVTEDVRGLAAAGKWPWTRMPVDACRFVVSGYEKRP